jgi:hypothetical protein
MTMMLAMESSVGQFVNHIQTLPIPLVAAWVVCVWLMRDKTGHIQGSVAQGSVGQASVTR